MQAGDPVFRFRCYKAGAAEIPALVPLRHALWPEGSPEEHAAELPGVLADPGSAVLVAAVARSDERGGRDLDGPGAHGQDAHDGHGQDAHGKDAGGRLVGWAEVRLRSYAEGCRTSPVGYLEGWYVEPEFRRRGVGAALVAAFEAWARDHGCTEVASDTGLDNAISDAAHRRLGYEEVDRAIHYRKALVRE